LRTCITEAIDVDFASCISLSSQPQRTLRYFETF